MNDFTLLITNWYRQNKRTLPWRETKNPYWIWLSEIILQQTRVDQGLAYYNTFVEKYPTVVDLANADEQSILNDWQGLGYYSRARNLHFSAKIIRDQYKGQFPPSFDEIIQLKGVGKYTAAAISSFAFGEKQAVVDGNVYRLLSRVFDMSTPIDSTKGQKAFQELADALITAQDPGLHNQAIMELGATICSPKKPNCDQCPLNHMCQSKQQNTIFERPVKEKKTKVRDRYFHYLVFHCQNETFIEQRTTKDIWQNMYQFPLIETGMKEITEEKDFWKSQVRESPQFLHLLSHQRLHVIFHHFDTFPKKTKPSWNRINMGDIQDFPLPRIIDKYLEDNSGLF